MYNSASPQYAIAKSGESFCASRNARIASSVLEVVQYKMPRTKAVCVAPDAEVGKEIWPSAACCVGDRSGIKHETSDEHDAAAGHVRRIPASGFRLQALAVRSAGAWSLRPEV